MKLLLLHGPAKVASRKKLIEVKQKFDSNNVVVFEEGSNSKDIIDNLMASSLFSDERLVILENPPEDFGPDSSLITSHLSLVLWFDHEVKNKSLLEKIKDLRGEVLFFPEAKEITIFPFLDMLANGEKGAFLELRKLKDRGFDIQYFIIMVFYLLRNLTVTPKTAPQFVRDKLIRQRKNFSKAKIAYLYKEFLEIDFKIKSGLLDITHAEFSLIYLFCH